MRTLLFLWIYSCVALLFNGPSWAWDIYAECNSNNGAPYYVVQLNADGQAIRGQIMLENLTYRLMSSVAAGDEIFGVALLEPSETSALKFTYYKERQEFETANVINKCIVR